MKMKRLTKKSLLLVSLLPALCGAQTLQDTLDVTLDRAIEIALNDNPTIHVADKDIALKRLADKDAWQQLLPSADISGTGSYTIKAATMKLGGNSFKMGSDGTSTYSGVLSVNVPVFAPAVYRTMKLTKTDIELAVEKSRDSRLDMINQITQAYFQLMLAQDTYNELLENYQQSQRNYDVVKAKYNVGTVSEYDKLSAEVQMRNSWPGVVSAQNGMRLASLQLKVLMGVTANVVFLIDDKLENYHDLVQDAFQTVDDISLQNNSALRQLDYNEQLLDHNLKIAQTAFMPTLALGYTYQYQSLYNTNFKFWHYDWTPSSTLSLTLSIPLYHASNFNKLKNIRIQKEQLIETKIDTERQLRMSAQVYLDNMTASAEQLVSNQTAIEAAKKELLISEKRYEVGRGTILELNSAQVALTQSMLAYTNSIYDYLVAKSNFEYVTGQNDFKIKK